MCDQDTNLDNKIYLRGSVSRRHFHQVLGTAALAALLPRAANAHSVTGRDVMIDTADGKADCYFVAPEGRKSPAVIVWPDILGLRPAFRLMGKRLAESGYAVLVVNPYYRMQRAPVVAEGESFSDATTRDKVMPLARSLSAATNTLDAQAFVAYLDQQTEVDTSRKIGTTGYCMGGPMTVRTAAAVPGRIGAGASFHGGRLVTDSPDSPHLLIPDINAAFLIAIAENDDEREPQTKRVLRTSFDEAGLAAEIEVYEGAMHGWCPPDSVVYNEVQAEHAWARLLVLFGKALV